MTQATLLPTLTVRYVCVGSHSVSKEINNPAHTCARVCVFLSHFSCRYWVWLWRRAIWQLESLCECVPEVAHLLAAKERWNQIARRHFIFTPTQEILYDTKTKHSVVSFFFLHKVTTFFKRIKETPPWPNKHKLSRIRAAGNYLLLLLHILTTINMLQRLPANGTILHENPPLKQSQHTQLN